MRLGGQCAASAFAIVTMLKGNVICVSCSVCVGFSIMANASNPDDAWHTNVLALCSGASWIVCSSTFGLVFACNVKGGGSAICSKLWVCDLSSMVFF